MIYHTRPKVKHDFQIEFMRQRILIWMTNPKDYENCEMLYIYDNGRWYDNACSIIKIEANIVHYKHEKENNWSNWTGEDIPAELILMSYKQYLTSQIEQALLLETTDV